MSSYERRNREIQRRCDLLLKEIERLGHQMLTYSVPGSRMHRLIHIPISTKDIDRR